MWKIRVLVLVGLALGLSFADVLAGHISFGTITTGFITKYHELPAGTFIQDLSGAATDGQVIVFADDGGNLPNAPLRPPAFIRVVTGGLPDTQAVNVPLAQEHKDLEGATFRNGVFAVITSHSKAGSENQPFRRLTRFKLREDTNQLKLQDEKSVDLRDPIMAALQTFGQAQFGNDDWFNRIKNADERAGGLNIEGLSTTGDDISDSLYVGILGPLFGPCFANPMCPNNLGIGEAIVVKVRNPFSSEPSFEFTKLNLLTARANHGIKGMELIPAMKGFVIIGGPVERGGDFSLWFWDGDAELERLDLPDTEPGNFGNVFRKLCRPEAVIPMEEKGEDLLVVFSEHSTPQCANAPFTFIKAHYRARK
jgi:hypothetical protein